MTKLLCPSRILSGRQLALPASKSLVCGKLDAPRSCPLWRRSGGEGSSLAGEAYILRRWLMIREDMNRKGRTALFLNHEGERLNRSGVFNAVVEAARRACLHDLMSERFEDHFIPHCCRHWFCTHLFRAGMRREYIKVLRGDSRKEAFDLHNHIDLKELKEAYLSCIPQLGIKNRSMKCIIQ